MKHLFLLLAIAAFFTSCNNSNSTFDNAPTAIESLCPSSSSEAFDLFKEKVQQKKLATVKQLCVQPENYIDTIFSALASPTVELIPEQADGAFGIKKMGSAEVYYTRILDAGKTTTIKAVLIEQNSDCFQIINIANVDTTGTK
jgi:hypothetical protein